MARAIDYYFTSISPFSYLGHRAIVEVADRHGAALNIKPINLFGLWKESAPFHWPNAHRCASATGSSSCNAPPTGAACRSRPDRHISPWTRPWPTTPSSQSARPAGMRATISARCSGQSGSRTGISARKASSPTCSRQPGHDASAILEAARSDAVAAIRAKNTEDAIAADAVGVPAYVLDGEPFWGQDRVEYVDRALASGRTPFAVPG